MIGAGRYSMIFTLLSNFQTRYAKKLFICWIQFGTSFYPLFLRIRLRNTGNTLKMVLTKVVMLSLIPKQING